MTKPKTYRFSTFQEMFDIVPSDRIQDCLDELGTALATAKASTELIAATAQALSKEPLPKMEVKLPEFLEWIDDHKQEIESTINLNGNDLFTVKVNPAQ